MDAVIRIVCILLLLYWILLFARVILSWIPRPISGIGRTLYDIVHDLTEPLLRLVRGLLPPIRMGMTGLDLSPIILFIAIGVIRSTLNCGSFGF